MQLHPRITPLLVALLITSPLLAADAPRPNIVFIFADDLGYNDVSFNGRTEWQTPNLDRLAQQGTRFTRWYTASVVCAPSRFALLTGRYGIHTGSTGNGSPDLPADEVTIAEALRRLGYATALFGKWHQGRVPKDQTPLNPIDQGFDEFFGFVNAVHAWQKFPEKLLDGRDEIEVSGYCDTLFTHRAIDFIRRHRDKPFFLYLPYTAPHFEIAAPPDEVSRFAGKFAEADKNEPLNATYAAMITKMDEEIGRVMATLDELGLAENTIVIFTSDHGATFEVRAKGVADFHDSNAPFRGQKRTIWEGGIRVPGIVRWPGKVPAGTVSEYIVHMIDVMPTLLAAAGTAPEPAWQVDGVNLLEVWRGRQPPPRRTVFFEWREGGDMQLAAMRNEFKLIINGGNKPELYNLTADPGERRNIIAQHPKLAKQLQQELEEWLAGEKQVSLDSP